MLKTLEFYLVTCICSVSGGDNAFGLVILSQTKIWAVYVPATVGAHDWPRFRVCFGTIAPVIHDKDTVIPLLSCICTRYANG